MAEVLHSKIMSTNFQLTKMHENFWKDFNEKFFNFGSK
jgi:hypothetical protein